MRFLMLSLMLGACALAGCERAAAPQQDRPPPFVKTIAVHTSSEGQLGLSGTVRARVETPLAFQVGGQIAARRVDAGHRVAPGQALFELDRRDLEQGVRAAAADLAAADAALATALADLARNRVLQQQRFTSAQALERFELAQREAQTRRDAAAARLAQARNALGYGQLLAPAAGVLIDVIGERGQVVSAGQMVATLAQDGERELELHFPQGVLPPASGDAVLADGTTLPLRLREIAGAVDPQGRTRRARYTVQAPQEALVLGMVLRARFAAMAQEAGEFAVPLGALNERGEGPRLWRVEEGRVRAVPVTVLGTDGETARVRGPLAAGDRIVALGTHLLGEGMAVRELDQ